MEFLDINLANDSRLLLHAIHSPFYWRILKETILFSGFKNPCKKIRETSNSSLRRLEFMPRNLGLKCRSRIPSLVRAFVYIQVRVGKSQLALLFCFM
jgi:hypothetical protein